MRGWPVNPAGRDAVRPLGARRPHAEGATPGRSRGCHALWERNAAGFASIVPRQCSVNSVKGTLSAKKRYVLSLTCRERFTSL